MRNDTTNGRISQDGPEIPQNEGDERALIGGLFCEPKQFDAIGDVDGEVFYSEPYRVIFGALCRLRCEGAPINPRTVIEAIERENKLHIITVDGFTHEEYLTRLGNDGHPYRAPYYAGRLRYYQKLRRIVQCCDHYREQACCKLPPDPGDLAQGFINDLEAVTAERGKSRLIVEEAANMKMGKTKHMWKDRLVADSLNGLVAMPMAGKTTVACGIAATVSTGAPWPDEPGVTREPRSVLYLSTEDHINNTILPRIATAGADLNFIAFIRSVQNPGTKHRSMINLARDLHEIDRELGCRPDVGLVIIDPIMGIMGGKVDTNSDAEVREVLGPFCEMLERRGVTALAITHMNKTSSVTQAMLRLMGSMAFVAQCRSVWFIDRDPADDRSRLLVPVKNNLSRVCTGLRFSIVDVNGEACVHWHDGTVDTTADELLEARNAAKTRRPRDDAQDWLKRRLDDGPVLSSVIKDEAEKMNFSDSTLNRAKKALDVATRYLSVPDSKAKLPHMMLPGDDRTESSSEEVLSYSYIQKTDNTEKTDKTYSTV